MESVPIKDITEAELLATLRAWRLPPQATAIHPPTWRHVHNHVHQHVLFRRRHDSMVDAALGLLEATGQPAGVKEEAKRKEEP